MVTGMSDVLWYIFLSRTRGTSVDAVNEKPVVGLSLCKQQTCNDEQQYVFSICPWQHQLIHDFVFFATSMFLWFPYIGLRRVCFCNSPISIGSKVFLRGCPWWCPFESKSARTLEWWPTLYITNKTSGKINSSMCWFFIDELFIEIYFLPRTRSSLNVEEKILVCVPVSMEMEWWSAMLTQYTANGTK